MPGHELGTIRGSLRATPTYKLCVHTPYSILPAFYSALVPNL